MPYSDTLPPELPPLQAPPDTLQTTLLPPISTLISHDGYHPSVTSRHASALHSPISHGSYSRSTSSTSLMDLDHRSAMTTPTPTPSQHSITSPSYRSATTNEDPDMRFVAEALAEMKTGSLSSPPSNFHSPTPMSPTTFGSVFPSHHHHHHHPHGSVSTTSSSSAQQTEPLLSLLTASHPLLATTIGNATSAYNSSKNYSPRFKVGAEYVEGYLTPIANTVGTVSRATGVEGGVRWFLGRRNRGGESSTAVEEGQGNHKRRRLGPDASTHSTATSSTAVSSRAQSPVHYRYDFSQASTPTLPPPNPFATRNPPTSYFDHSRRASQASSVTTLPSYTDDPQAPEYSDTDTSRSYSIASDNNQKQYPQQQEQQQGWRLFKTTSSLGAAMNEQSLRSLKYCLNWVRVANGRIGQTIRNLKSTLDEFDRFEERQQQQQQQQQQRQNYDSQNHSRNLGQPIAEASDSPGVSSTDLDLLQRVAEGRLTEEEQQMSRNELIARITTLKTDVLRTVQETIDTISKYAGGALPENARIFVHRHLTSLPQRFRIAAMQEREANSLITAGTNTEHQSTPRDVSGTGPSPSSGSAAQQAMSARDRALRDGAQRVLVLARESLDMMGQVSGVLDGTITSAEEWCEKLGQKQVGPAGLLVESSPMSSSMGPPSSMSSSRASLSVPLAEAYGRYSQEDVPKQ